MAIYEFQYQDAAGKTVRVERFFPMSKRPDTIVVQDGEECYTAHHVMSLTAGRHSSWDSYEDSQLPPNNGKLVE